ncbi:MAG: hypothetical protein ACRD2W_25395, partial [Acidimicrobiales bacterium]
ALTTQGIALADLTPEALLHYAKQCRELLVGVANTHTTRFSGHLAWEVLHAMGHFPPRAARTLREAMRTGRLTVPEMVRRYPVANATVAQLFVDYLTRRQPGLDYGSLEQLSRLLVSTFGAESSRSTPGRPIYGCRPRPISSGAPSCASSPTEARASTRTAP